MDKWILTGVRRFERREEEKLTITETQVKVRITYVRPCYFDSLCFTGENKIRFPRIPCRNAVGVVLEVGAKCYGITVGSRVYLNPMRPCKKCYECKKGNYAGCLSPLSAVRDFDGFLRDFIVCEYTEVTAIPDSVDDMHALCIENVALAENIFGRLNLSIGSKVAIIGAGFSGSIFAQVAIYKKLVPIIIDSYPQNIARLKRSGVFFSCLADDNLLHEIELATSGTLCDAAIYTSECKLPASIPAKVLARNKDLVLGGLSAVNFNFDSSALFEKNMRLYSVMDGYGYIETAMNMLTHGVLDLTNFEKTVITKLTDEDIADLAVSAPRNGKMIVLKLIL